MSSTEDLSSKVEDGCEIYCRFGISSVWRPESWSKNLGSQDELNILLLGEITTLGNIRISFFL